MKSITVYLITLVMITAATYSCKKAQLSHEIPESPPAMVLEKKVQQEAFAKALAKAVREEKALRKFIKEEALKKFDKDDDILYQMVKDKKTDNQSTLHDLLMRHADDKELFEQACDNQPLLTIFVPTLPNLSPENWDPANQIPKVAIEPDHRINAGKVNIYDHAGHKEEVASHITPGFPVLVVKTNERVVLSSYHEIAAHTVVESTTQPFFSNGKFSFKFRDKVFDGLTSKTILTRSGTNNILTNSYTIDKINVDAYNSGSEWHRDYVYYGITPQNQIGTFTNRYMEYIRSFKFVNGDDLYLVSNQADDPEPDRLRTVNDPHWIDGRFDFRISIFINAKNGVGQELRKSFGASGNDLFELNYKALPSPIGPPIFYSLTSITPKEFDPNIQIESWDLEQYGTAWKFAIIEYDPAEEKEYEITHSSEFGANFEINIGGEKVKVGGKFGASASVTHSTTYRYKITTGSDELSDAILDFRKPVITSLSFSFGKERYQTFEISTGKVSMSVEPLRIIN